MSNATIELRSDDIELYDEGKADSREPYYENDGINWNLRCDEDIFYAIIDRAGLTEVYNNEMEKGKNDIETINFSDGSSLTVSNEPSVEMYISVTTDKAVSIDVEIKSEGEIINGGEGKACLDDLENEIALTAIDKYLAEHNMNSLDNYLDEAKENSIENPEIGE